MAVSKSRAISFVKPFKKATAAIKRRNCAGGTSFPRPQERNAPFANVGRVGPEVTCVARGDFFFFFFFSFSFFVVPRR